MADTTKQDAEFLQQFEPDVFWQQHSRKILIGVAALVLIGGAVYYRQRQAAELEDAAAAELAHAKEIGELQRLAQDYRGKPIGAQALLRLAEAQVRAKQFKEAGATFQRFLQEFPQHLMAETAQLGVATSLEAQGDFAAAKAQYQQIVSAHPTGYVTPAARLGLARCSETLGMTKEARQAYEELRPAIRGSPWETEVYIRSMVLERSQEPSTNVPVAGAPLAQP